MYAFAHKLLKVVTVQGLQL